MESQDARGSRRLPRGLVAVVAVWLAVRLLIYGGLSASDPLEYLEYAQRIAAGTFELEPHHYVTRFAVTAPIALCFKLFGVSIVTATIWPLLCSLITLLLVYHLGRRFGDHATGLIAATTFALLPLDISDSTNVLPDPVLAMFATLSIACFLRGWEREDAARARSWLLAAGVLLWCAYSAKIAGALLAVAFLLHAISDRRRARRLGWVALGSLLLLVPELAIYHFVTGDVLLPLSAIGEVHETSIGVQAANEDLAYRLLRDYPRKTLLPNEHFGILMPFIALASIVLLRDFRRLRMLYFWILVFGAYLNFGSSSLSSYVAIPANTRYLQPVVVPGLVLLALAARRTWLGCARLRRGAQARTVLAGTGALLATSLLATAYLHAGRSFTHLTAREGFAAARLLAQTKPDVVHADPRTASVLAFAFAYELPFEVRPFPKATAEMSGDDYLARFPPRSVVLLNWREIHKYGSIRTFSEGQKKALLSLRDRPGLALVARLDERPDTAYYRLAGLPWLRPEIRRDEMLEFFHWPDRPRGTWYCTVSLAPGAEHAVPVRGG